MILDSTFLIDILRGDAEVSTLIEEIDAAGTPLVSAVTVLELDDWIHFADATDEERTRGRGCSPGSTHHHSIRSMLSGQERSTRDLTPPLRRSTKPT